MSAFDHQGQKTNNTPEETSKTTTNGSSSSSTSAATAAAAALLFFNKHQLNNYNSFLEHFDKLNQPPPLASRRGLGATTTTSLVASGGKKREHTPSQSIDELQQLQQLSNYLNPAYEDLKNGSINSSSSPATSNHGVKLVNGSGT